jgi:hypothetical protein
LLRSFFCHDKLRKNRDGKLRSFFGHDKLRIGCHDLSRNGHKNERITVTNANSFFNFIWVYFESSFGQKSAVPDKIIFDVYITFLAVLKKTRYMVFPGLGMILRKKKTISKCETHCD